jgi:hypothetical protein
MLEHLNNDGIERSADESSPDGLELTIRYADGLIDTSSHVPT